MKPTVKTRKGHYGFYELAELGTCLTLEFYDIHFEGFNSAKIFYDNGRQGALDYAERLELEASLIRKAVAELEPNDPV